MKTLEQAYSNLELGKKWCPGCCGARVPSHWTQSDCPRCERDRALLEQMDDDMQRACEMDPQACFNTMLDNEHGEIELYNDCKSSLIAWLASGGFGPEVVYAPPVNFTPTLDKRAHGRKGQLVALTYTGDATVRWGNGRQSIVRLIELGYES